MLCCSSVHVWEMLLELESKLAVRGKSSRRHKPVLSKILGTNFNPEQLSTKKDPPRLVLVDTTGFIAADGMCIECKNNTIIEMVLELMMAYYAWDLCYPKQYQLLGFIQKYVLKDEAVFAKSALFVKFEENYSEFGWTLQL